MRQFIRNTNLARNAELRVLERRRDVTQDCLKLLLTHVLQSWILAAHTLEKGCEIRRGEQLLYIEVIDKRGDLLTFNSGIRSALCTDEAGCICQFAKFAEHCQYLGRAYALTGCPASHPTEVVGACSLLQIDAHPLALCRGIAFKVERTVHNTELEIARFGLTVCRGTPCNSVCHHDACRRIRIAIAQAVHGSRIG